MMIHIFAVSGSLRKVSTNTALVQRFAELAPDGCTVDFYNRLGDLPHFNPDDEIFSGGVVADLIDRVRHADAFVVSTPEYAHGMPGVLKNCLDWLVGSDAFIDKPFSLLSACPRSQHAPASLTEVLKTMSGRHILEADVTVDLKRNPNNVSAVLLGDDVATRLVNSLASLRSHCELGCQPKTITK